MAITLSQSQIAMVPLPMSQWCCRPLALASLPLLRWRCRPRRTGIGSHVIALVAKAPHVVKAPWLTLMPFTFALARLLFAGHLCCAGGVNCSGAFCIVARGVMVPLPTLHWRRLVSHVVLVAKGLAGRCSDLAAVASRSHCRQPADTALPPLQPSTLSRSCHRCIASALSWS